MRTKPGSAGPRPFGRRAANRRATNVGIPGICRRTVGMQRRQLSIRSKRRRQAANSTGYVHPVMIIGEHHARRHTSIELDANGHFPVAAEYAMNRVRRAGIPAPGVITVTLRSRITHVGIGVKEFHNNLLSGRSAGRTAWGKRDNGRSATVGCNSARCTW